MGARVFDDNGSARAGCADGGNGQRFTGLGIREIVREHVQDVIRRVLQDAGKSVVDGSRVVVDPGDVNRDRGNGRRTAVVGHGVVEGVREKLAGQEFLKHVQIPRVVRKRSVGAEADSGSQRAGAAGGEVQRIVAVRVAGGRCEASAHRRVFSRIETCIFSRGSIVQARHRNADRGDALPAVSVANRIVESVRLALSRPQEVERSSGIVIESAVVLIGDLALCAGSVDAQDRQCVVLGIGIVVQHVAGDEGGVLIGGEGEAPVVQGDGSVVDAVDCDSHCSDGKTALSVAEFILEALGPTLTGPQFLELSIGRVVEGAIAVVGELSEDSGRVGTDDRQGAPVDIAVVGQHVGREEVAVLVGGKTDTRIVHGDRRVVESDHRDRYLAVTRSAFSVAERVDEAVGGGLARAQEVEFPVGIVAVSTVAVGGYVTHGAVRVDPGNRQRVALGIGIVVQHVVCIERGVLIGGEAQARIGVGHRRIIHTVDGDRHRGDVGAAVSVTDGVAERVGRRLPRSQRFELCVGIVVEGAVVVGGHLAGGEGRVQSGYRKRIAIHVVVVIENVARCERRILVGPISRAAIVLRHGRVVLGCDGHGHNGFLRNADTVAQFVQERFRPEEVLGGRVFEGRRPRDRDLAALIGKSGQRNDGRPVVVDPVVAENVKGVACAVLGDRKRVVSRSRQPQGLYVDDDRCGRNGASAIFNRVVKRLHPDEPGIRSVNDR